MPRLPLAACLFLGAALLASLGSAQQPEKKQPAKAKVDPATLRPDAATLKTIQEKTESLRKAVAALREKKIPDNVLIEVEIFLKAAENIVRFEEWFAKDSVKWCLTTLDRGLERAKEAHSRNFNRGVLDHTAHDLAWQRTKGTWIVKSYRSEVDNSIQPYAVLLPEGYGKDWDKVWPLDVILHGRDSSITEAKFIATHEGRGGPPPRDRILMEVYGRGNNAYRWAGEADVFEAIEAFGIRLLGKGSRHLVDESRIVLRGFSMGGAGTWHIGLHHPDRFCVIGPGAGFTTTRGYIRDLPAKLPDHQEKCLRIYDAVDYAENALNVPIVAYSGELDEQKAAADNIERAIRSFKEPTRFTHLIGPGLKHEMPKEWQDKAEAEYRRYREKGRETEPKRIRFVTYTPQYGKCDWLNIVALERTYEKATVDASWSPKSSVVKTQNVRELGVPTNDDGEIVVDGQKLKVKEGDSGLLEKKNGQWSFIPDNPPPWVRVKQRLFKRTGQSGPIDDAFRSYFWVVNRTLPGWSEATDKHTQAALAEFASTWDRYFRGKIPTGEKVEVHSSFPTDFPKPPHVVLFGDPASNPEIAKLLPRLPIKWTREELVVNGVAYDSRTHVPILIYPHPHYDDRYIVLNSGHTFREADLKDTNARLFPRLGDWAVIKPTPTAKDPAAYEVVAAGLFDENWQFPKK